MRTKSLFCFAITSFFSLFLVSCSFVLPPSSNEHSFHSSIISSSSSNNTISSNSSISSISYSSKTSNNETEEKCDDLYIHFLELGNKFVGDAIYIKAGNTDILIDAGSRTTSSATLTKYINKYCFDGILEYVIATHAHQDHIEGFIGSKANPGIFDTYQCETIIDFPKTNQQLLSASGNDTTYGKYVKLRNAEIEEGANHYTAIDCYYNQNNAKRVYEVAKGITLSILYNEYYEIESKEENNYSVCVLLSQNDNHFLFTGDLECDGEEKLVKNNSLPHVKVLKGGHHGSNNANSDALLNAVTPENVCICTCAGTSEYTDVKENQFPYQETINRIAIHTKNIYITSQVNKYVDHSDWSKTGGGSVKSMNGNIIVSSKSDSFEIHGSNNDIILKDTEWFKENRTWPENGV